MQGLHLMSFDTRYVQYCCSPYKYFSTAQFHLEEYCLIYKYRPSPLDGGGGGGFKLLFAIIVYQVSKQMCSVGFFKVGCLDNILRRHDLSCIEGRCATLICFVLSLVFIKGTYWGVVCARGEVQPSPLLDKLAQLVTMQNLTLRYHMTSLYTKDAGMPPFFHFFSFKRFRAQRKEGNGYSLRRTLAY